MAYPAAEDHDTFELASEDTSVTLRFGAIALEVMDALEEVVECGSDKGVPLFSFSTISLEFTNAMIGKGKGRGGMLLPLEDRPPHGFRVVVDVVRGEAELNPVQNILDIFVRKQSFRMLQQSSERGVMQMHSSWMIHHNCEREKGLKIRPPLRGGKIPGDPGNAATTWAHGGGGSHGRRGPGRAGSVADTCPHVSKMRGVLLTTVHEVHRPEEGWLCPLHVRVSEKLWLMCQAGQHRGTDLSRVHWYD